MKKITVKELAGMAGVSKATISRVINNQEGISDKKRKEILKLIKKHSYKPNPIAQNLALNRTGNIGLILPHDAKYSFSISMYWPILLASVINEAAASNLAVVLATAQKEGEVASAYDLIMSKRRIDGLIVGAEWLDEKRLASIIDHEIPVVTIGRDPDIHVPYVDIDNRKAVYDMTVYLQSLGYERFLFLAGPSEFPSVCERVKGFEEAAAKLRITDYQIHHSRYLETSAAEIFRSCYRKGVFPDVVFSAAGDFVLDLLTTFHSMGLSVPEDIGLATFDDVKINFGPSKRITSIHQPVDKMGKAAFQILLSLMDKKKPPEEIEKGRILETILIPGQTVWKKTV